MNGLDDKFPNTLTRSTSTSTRSGDGHRRSMLDTPLWRDTFVLTGKNDDSFTFETNFLDFIRRFPDHCHIVSHEDLGMMEIVEVVA